MVAFGTTPLSVDIVFESSLLAPDLRRAPTAAAVLVVAGPLGHLQADPLEPALAHVVAEQGGVADAAFAANLRQSAAGDASVGATEFGHVDVVEEHLDVKLNSNK